MSRILQNEKDFIKLILKTNRRQALALLETITDNQLKVLTEIAHNLLTLPLKKNSLSVVTKRKRVLRKIADTTLSTCNKIELVKTHKYQILNTLLSFKSLLTQILK